MLKFKVSLILTEVVIYIQRTDKSIMLTLCISWLPLQFTTAVSTFSYKMTCCCSLLLLPVYKPIVPFLSCVIVSAPERKKRLYRMKKKLESRVCVFLHAIR